MPTARRASRRPAGAVNPGKSMARTARRATLSIVNRGLPRVHDARLITADRRDGGFCVNWPKTNPRDAGTFRGAGGRCLFVWHYAGPCHRSRVTAREKQAAQTAHPLKSFNKIWRFRPIALPDGRHTGLWSLGVGFISAASLSIRPRRSHPGRMVAARSPSRDAAR